MINNEKAANFALDKALRFVLLSLRNEGDVLLAVRFRHRGKEYSADTPEELTALKEHLEAQDREEAIGVDPETAEELLYETTKWTPDKFYEFVNNIGRGQKIFLAILLGASHSVRAEDVQKKMHLPSLLALAGIQSGLTKQMRLLDLEPIDLYQVRIDWTEGERKRFFSLDRGFRLAAQDAEWPSVDIRKEIDAASTKGKRK